MDPCRLASLLSSLMFKQEHNGLTVALIAQKAFTGFATGEGESMLSGAQKARHLVLNTYSGGMVNIYAACRVSVGVMKSHVVLLCYKMA